MTEPKAPMGVEEAINYAVSLIANVAELVPSAPEEQEKAARHIATLKAHLAALAQPKEEGVVHTAVADGHGLAPDVAARFSDEVVERMARAHYIAYAPSDDARQARENFWDNVLDHKRPWVEIMRAALADLPPPPSREEVWMRTSDELATDAYSRGFQAGRADAGGKKMAALLMKLDGLKGEVAILKALNRFLRKDAEARPLTTPKGDDHV
jgi:truncated hemoglobin YjbI